MRIRGVEIEDTFAEAFYNPYSRILITAATKKWAGIAAQEMAGYATSMIECSAEAGIEGYVIPRHTPDNRHGCVVQIWTSKKRMKDELLDRIGQCVLTAPTTAVWNWCNSKEKLDVGYKMRFFGDGYEEIKKIYNRDVVSIPVMLGNFFIEREFGVAKGVAGGNFLILADSQNSALSAGESAIEAINSIEGVIAPFPGGICGAGSKIGSKKYKFMRATTNERYCPTIADKVKDTKIEKGINGVAEIVVNGISLEAVMEGMRAGIRASSRIKGVKKISAGNYDGKLGDVKIELHTLFR